MMKACLERIKAGSVADEDNPFRGMGIVMQDDHNEETVSRRIQSEKQAQLVDDLSKLNQAQCGSGLN